MKMANAEDNKCIVKDIFPMVRRNYLEHLAACGADLNGSGLGKD